MGLVGMQRYMRTKDQIVESAGNSNPRGICRVLYSTDTRNNLTQKQLVKKICERKEQREKV